MKPSNASSELPAVPSLRDEAGWLVPSKPHHAQAAVSLVVAMLDPGEEERQVVQLVQMVAKRGYSVAELAFAANELLYDETLARRLSYPEGRNQGITPADFERVIVGHRRLRKQLTMPLRQIDVNRLVMEYPGQLSLEDFGVCGFDGMDQPLYRYAKKGPIESPPPLCPQLPEKTVERTGDGSGIVKLGDVLSTTNG